MKPIAWHPNPAPGRCEAQTFDKFLGLNQCRNHASPVEYDGHRVCATHLRNARDAGPNHSALSASIVDAAMRADPETLPPELRELVAQLRAARSR